MKFWVIVKLLLLFFCFLYTVNIHQATLHQRKTALLTKYVKNHLWYWKNK